MRLPRTRNARKAGSKRDSPDVALCLALKTDRISIVALCSTLKMDRISSVVLMMIQT